MESARSPHAALAGRRRWATGTWVLICALAASTASASGDVDLAAARVDAGQFAAAESGIAAALAVADLDADTRRALEFQRERMRRIRLDFTLDAEALKARVRESIADLTEAQFADWDARGLFESQLIDGRMLYFNRAPSNLFRLSREALARRKPQKPLVDGPMEHANAHHAEVRAAALAGGVDSVAPRRVRVKQSLTVHADAVPAGERVRAWIPYPRAIAGQQDGIHFVGSEPAKHQVAPESALQRTVYLEKRAVAGRPTEFAVRYEVTVHARYHAIDADKVQRAPVTPELAPFVAEQPPHIVFTEAMRLFSRQVVGEETDPWRIARKLYAAVDQVPWAGAREYSTIGNIGDYALHAGHADCGQQTLLLMTLLRMNGIPARWQSGMVYSDGDYDNLHDWGQLYVAPYGWIPMDVTFGRLDGADPAVADFYLGGLDAYRLAFNDDWGRDFVPPKTHFRSDTVDSQRGEAEWRGGNLYYDQWDYHFEARVERPR
ncbi:transglutaminase domain-containing protein [Dokdonella sp.]|uniref:transglutaminase-like domain-containing protein n=1 Tax=Dokdonella sp. TaxID=2291710 RepID=UPI001B2D2B38|nr:transglutaminase domain-containing protein [Dokdonella sp.]MBO9663766.1 transglutaminase domain-containing protein [Dokdonella sp.]